MNVLRNLFRRPLMGELMAAKVAQIACYVVATGVFILAMLKLTRLPLTEAELFFGILQVIAVFALMLCAGTLVRIEAELRCRRTMTTPSAIVPDSDIPEPDIDTEV